MLHHHFPVVISCYRGLAVFEASQDADMMQWIEMMSLNLMLCRLQC